MEKVRLNKQEQYFLQVKYSQQLFLLLRPAGQ